MVAFLGSSRSLAYALNMLQYDEHTNLLIVCLTNEIAHRENILKARSCASHTNQGGFLVIRQNFSDPKSEENTNKMLRRVKCALQNYPITTIPLIEEELDF